MEWVEKTYKYYVIDFILIFLFYVFGDTFTTWIMLFLGHNELNLVVLKILDLNYGIIIYFGLKLILFFYIIIYYYYLLKIINISSCDIIIKKYLFLFMRCGSFFILMSGIILTTNNIVIILSRHNIFQLL